MEAGVDARWDYLNQQSIRSWERIVINPLGKLQIAEALLARYDTGRDQGSLALSEKRSWLRDRIASLLRECDPKLSKADYHVRCMVTRLFPKGGLRRLEDRADAQIAESEAA